jgi:hypothetical protein
MNCDWVQQNIALYLYGELADDARYERGSTLRAVMPARRNLRQRSFRHR